MSSERRNDIDRTGNGIGQDMRASDSSTDQAREEPLDTRVADMRGDIGRWINTDDGDHTGASSQDNANTSADLLNLPAAVRAPGPPIQLPGGARFVISRELDTPSGWYEPTGSHMLLTQGNGSGGWSSGEVLSMLVDCESAGPAGPVTQADIHRLDSLLATLRNDAGLPPQDQRYPRFDDAGREGTMFLIRAGLRAMVADYEATHGRAEDGSGLVLDTATRQEMAEDEADVPEEIWPAVLSDLGWVRV